MISIIIIVKNDRGVEKTLQDIFNVISLPEKVETIVVDGSGGKLNDIRNKYSKAKWIEFVNDTKATITIPQQRNAGLREATGDVIVFTDASCSLDKNWLETLYSDYLNGEKIVAGRIETSNPDVINNITARSNETKSYIQECATANVLFSKVVIDKVGWFDETFEYGSDTDYTWRARNLGFKILFNSRAVITHDWGDSKQQYKRCFYYGKGRMHLYLKHKDRIKNVFANDPVLVFYPVFFLFLPIVLFWPFYIFLLIIPLIKNFNKKPVDTMIQNSIFGMGGLYYLFVEQFT